MVKSFYRKFIDWRRKAKAYKDLRKSGVVITSDSFLGEDTTIGFGTKINGTCFLGSNVGSPIRIGRYCAIAHNLRIRSRNHNIKSVNMQNQFARAHGFKQNIDIRGSVEIGSGVWIGDNVLILSGVKIGDGAVIGAGSVVTRNIFPYGVACGVPAREYKKRFAPEVVKLLINTCWWNWSEEKIRRNKTFFEADLTKLNVDQIVDIMID